MEPVDHHQAATAVQTLVCADAPIWISKTSRMMYGGHGVDQWDDIEVEADYIMILEDDVALFKRGGVTHISETVIKDPDK